MPFVEVTWAVVNCGPKVIVERAEQPLNISLIVVTLAVLNPERSRAVRTEHWRNMPDMEVTSAVVKAEPKVIDSRAEQPKNI